MKKLMLTIASLLFVSVMAVTAQVQDTTSASQPSSGYQQQDLNYDELEAVQSTDVPASLRSSLQGSEYSGWEAGKVYRHKTNNEYVVVIGDENAKVYRFDNNGNRVEDGSSMEQSDKAAPESGTPPTGSAPESTSPTPLPSPTPAPTK